MRLALRALLIVVASVFAPLVAPALTASPPQLDYAQEGYIFEKVVFHHTFDAQGTRTTETEVRARIMSAAGLRELGTMAFAYRRDLGTLDIDYLRVRKPTGEIIETPVSTAIELPADITRTAPTFTDIHAKNLNVQGLAVGDVVEYRTRVRERSVIPGRFWFEWPWSGDVIALDVQMSVSIPAGITAIVKSRDLEPAVSVANGERTYVWHRQTLKRPTESEQSVRDYGERELRPAVQISSFRSWADVGEAVGALWKDRAAVTPSIRAKALELTRDAKTDADKIDRLYAFVATRIRYVAVSLGVGSVQPHAADDVLKTGFGDCKDKHTLLAALLGAVGIAADAALIGVGEGFDGGTPSLSPFNHVITVVHEASSVTWLDATLEVAPRGFLAAAERDRSVLLLPASGAALVTKTPAAPSRPNEWRVAVEGTLDANGKLVASVTETMSGDSELFMRTVFRALPKRNGRSF